MSIFSVSGLYFCNFKPAWIGHTRLHPPMRPSAFRLAAAAAVASTLFGQAEGYTAAEIRKIYGENTLSLMTAVERASAHGGGGK